MAKPNRDLIFKETTQGNFKFAINALKKRDLVLNDGTAVNLLICCTNALKKTENVKILPDDLLKVIIFCCETIQELSNKSLASYLPCIFHILNYYVNNVNFKQVLQLEIALLPKFKFTLIDNTLALYTNICHLLHNKISAFSRTGTVSAADGKFIQEICVMAVKMYLQVLPPNVVLETKASAYFKVFNYIKVKPSSQYQCYLSVLNLIKSSKKVDDSDGTEMYVALVNLLRTVVEPILRQNEYELAEDCFKACESALDVFCKSAVHIILTDVLKRCSHILQSLEKKKFEQLYEAFKTSSKLHSGTSEFEAVCYVLCTVSTRLAENYSKSKHKPTEEILYLWCKFVMVLSHYVAQYKKQCSTCQDCGIKTNLKDSVSILNTLGSLTSSALSNNVNISGPLNNMIYECFKKCCVHVISLRNSCATWKFSWKCVGTSIFNIGIKYFYVKNENCIDYFLLVVRHIILLEFNQDTVMKEESLQSILILLSEMYIHMHEYPLAMFYSALNIILSTSNRDKAFVPWVRAKASMKDSSKEEAVDSNTIVDVLEQNMKEVNEFCPNLVIDKDTRQELLLFELSGYKTVWPSKLSMIVTYLKLSEIASNFVLAKILVKVWGDKVLPIPNEAFLKALHEVVTNFEKEIENNFKGNDECIEKYLYLAYLHLIYYNCQMVVIRQKNCDDIKGTVSALKPALLPHEMPSNLNDECDLVSSYSSLQLDNMLKIMKNLESSLHILDNFVLKNVSPYIVTILKQEDVFNLVVKVAQEYRLHCCSLQVLQSWLLGLKLGRLLEDKTAVLVSIAHLIEISDVRSENVQDLFVEGDGIVMCFKNSEDCKELYAIVLYYMNKSYAHLRSEDVQTGLAEYQNAMHYFSKVDEKNADNLLKLQLKHLHTLYLRLPCDLKIDGHDKLALVKPHEVLDELTVYTKTKGRGGSYGAALMFEAATKLVHNYAMLRLPREVRCYCRDLVVLSQQLAIPLRTAYFLTILATADLLCARIDDCQVKLNGLSDILGLKRYRGTAVSCLELSKRDLEATEEVEHISLKLNEMVLDYPSSVRPHQATSGSPIFFTKPFTLPPYVNHPTDCNCFYCMSAEYHELVLTTIKLEADLNVNSLNVSAAQDFFGGALKLYDHVMTKQGVFSKNVVALLNVKLLPQLSDLMCESYCALLLSFGNNLIRINNANKAKTINNLLVNTISEKKYRNVHLYNEALLQKLALCMASELPKIKCNNHLDVEESAAETNKVNKTPENKRSKIVFPISCSPRPNSPPKRNFASIKFVLPENEDTCNEIVAKTPRNRIKSNRTETSKIPAPPNSKIKIYVPNSVKSTRKKKPATTVTSTLSSETKKEVNVPTLESSSPITPNAPKTITKTSSIQSRSMLPTATKRSTTKKLSNIPITDTKIHNIEDSISESCLIIPGSPNAYTPSSQKAFLKLESCLQSRTKLLTEKLKKSTVKTKLENVSNDDKIKPIRSSIRKNLMSQLTENVHNIQTTKDRCSTIKAKCRNNSQESSSGSSTENKSEGTIRRNSRSKTAKIK